MGVERARYCKHPAASAARAAMYDLGQLPPAETVLFSALAQKGWIEYNASAKSFKCSPVVQEITKKKHPRLLEDCRTLIKTLTDKLLYEPCIGHLLATTYAEAALFARYAEGVVHAFAQTEEATAIPCDRIGSYHSTTGNLDKALGFYEEDLRLTKELYGAYPNNVSFKNGLAVSNAKLGVFSRDNRHDKEKARTYFQQAEGLWLELTWDAPGFEEFRRFLAQAQRDLKTL